MSAFFDWFDAKAKLEEPMNSTTYKITPNESWSSKQVITNDLIKLVDTYYFPTPDVEIIKKLQLQGVTL